MELDTLFIYINLSPSYPVMIGIRLFVLIDAAKVRRFFGF